MADATREQADVCIARFITDLGLDAVTSEFVKVCREAKMVGNWPDVEFVEGDPDGRFEYLLRRGEWSCSVEMPGLDLDKVRYVDSETQNIWDFPRLYVAESSWVWCFGVNVATSILSGQDEEDDD